MLKKMTASGLFFFLLISLLPVSDRLAAKDHSRAVVASDAATGAILFSQNANHRLPPASTTKLITAIVALENEPLSKVVTISRNAAQVEPSKAGFKEGDRITVEGLLYAALMESANDAAVANCAMSYPKLREIVGTPETQIATEGGKTFFLRSTDKLLWSDGKVIGGKTGYTRKARHCFVGAARNETKTVIVALLGSPSRKSLWAEAEKLITRALHGTTA
ncbi:MAG: D-alanyl-D-alanine carboxypeptidase [Deltaproteobacteria bacterium]|nr:D-alanyl-D-alanine carboxypeptidase [Deltaproteobacteria bacterium]